MSRTVMSVTPNSVMPYGYATYGTLSLRITPSPRVTPHVTPCQSRYAKWLRHVRLRGFRQIRLRHIVTPHTVTPHVYATYGHVGYAKFGYATWLRHVRLHRLCHRLRQTRLRHIVTPHVVTPRLCQIHGTWLRRLRHGYAKFGYVTWLRRLRQTRLCHIVTPRGYVGYATVTPNSVTSHGYAGYAKHGYAT